MQLMTVLRNVNKLSIVLAAYSFAFAVYVIPCGWVGAVVLVIGLVRRKGTQVLHAYGTARWATYVELREKNMLEGPGIPVGYVSGELTRMNGLQNLFDRRLSDKNGVSDFIETCQGALQRRGKSTHSLVRLTNAVHTMVVAPTGAGKGVSLVIPHLLSCEDSMVVLDPKGENYTITAARRMAMGHQIIRLDPFEVCGPDGDTFNPMDTIRYDDEQAIDNARAMAEAMVMRSKNASDTYWDDSAQIWIASMISAIIALAPPNARNLQSVRANLTDPAKRVALIEMMCKSTHWQGMLSRLGHSLKNFQNKTLDSVMTATNRHMDWADTIPVARCLQSSSFNPMEMRTKRTTVYLILPPKHQRQQAPLVRLWLSSLLRACVEGGIK